MTNGLNQGGASTNSEIEGRRQVKARPILFSGSMVRALLDGRKTQTRRPLSFVAPDEATNAGVFCSPGTKYDGEWNWLSGNPEDCDSWGFIGKAFRCPYGQPGDLLWVREAFAFIGVGKPCYAASATTDHPGYTPSRWRPSVHMPRSASRLTLCITDVRVQRLQEISEEDAQAEGADAYDVSMLTADERELLDAPLLEPANPYRNGFALLWDSIYAADGLGWNDNPYVWVPTFEVIHKNVDEVLRDA